MKYYLIKTDYEPWETRTLKYPDTSNKTSYHFVSENVVELTKEELFDITKMLLYIRDYTNGQTAQFVKDKANKIQGKIRKVLE